MADCCHRWLLDSPNGPEVEGQCSHCGAKRIFTSSFHENDPRRRKVGGPVPLRVVDAPRAKRSAYSLST